jgi:hypothetical protein
MRISNARTMPDGSVVINQPGGEEKSFGDMEGFIRWVQGPPEDGWEAIQAYVGESLKNNPAWNDVPNLKDTDYTLTLSVRAQKVVN